MNSDNGLPAHSVQWTDAAGQPRTAVMVDQRPAGAGYLRRLTYRFDGANRVCTGTGDNGHMGDGYVQNHTAYGGDVSSHGVPGTTTVALSGPHHVIISYDMPGYSISGQSVPTTVQWFFADGRPHPIFALSQDARATAGNIGADSRSPYGDVAYDGGVGSIVGGASFGDTYKFTTLAANPERVTKNSGWRYDEANTIPYAMQWSDPAQVDAEMGHVATVPITVQDAGSDPRSTPRVDVRGKQAPNGPMIDDENWSYQILNYVLPNNGTPTSSKRLTWGTEWGLPGGFDNYGDKSLNVRQYSQHADSHNGAFNGTRADGMLMAYSTFVVFGPHTGGYKDGTVGQVVKQVENAAAASLSAVIGSVRASGPYGVGNAANANRTYSPGGYNPIFATWELDVADNAVEATLVPAAGKPLDHPIFVVNGYTAAQLPASIEVGDGLTTPEVDYFATLDAANQRIWITVNRSSGTPITLKFGGGVVPQAPMITSIPASGTVGSSIVITGNNFSGATEVKFNGLSASYSVDSATQITATIPADATAGPITVTTPGGTATSAQNFTPMAAPAAQTTSIYTDELHDAADWSWATTDIANTTPVHSGSKSIKVTADAYEAFRVHFNTPVSPAPYVALSFWIHGGTAGGQPLLIQATVNDKALSGVPLASPSANAWQEYTVTLADLGLSDKPNFDGFWIQNNSGQTISAFYVDDIDLVAPIREPFVSAFTPPDGLVGSSVVITGENFHGAASVLFNTTEAIFTLDSSTQITAVVPAGATQGPISVITPNGTATSLLNFTPTAPPQENTLAIYTDDLHDAADWSWATVDFSNTSPVHSGTKSIAVNAGAYQAMRVHFNTPISPAPYAALSFWLHGGTTGSQPLVLQATVNDKALTGVPLEAPQAATWQKYTVKLVDLSLGDKPDFDGFWIQNNSGQVISVFYVDDIELLPGEMTPPLTNPGFTQMYTDDGGWFTGFAIHPSGRVYGRTDVGGLYRSDDHGDSWQFLSGDMTTISSLAVQGVAVAEDDPDVVYQCVGVSYAPPADQGIWKSTDGGATWNLMKVNLHFSGNDAERWGGECIAIRPGQSSEVWAGTRGDGLWRTTDAGLTWLETGGFQGAQFTSVSLPPKGRSDIWVGASGFSGPGGVWVSVNDGVSWTQITGARNGVDAPAGVWRIVREPSGKVLVAGGNDALGSVLFEFDAADWNTPATYTWNDISWPDIDRSQPAPLVAALEDGRVVAGSIFGGYNGGPNSLRTQVRGLAGTWSPIDDLTGPMPAWQRSPAPTLIEGGRNALVQDPSDPARWFMAGGYGPFRTTDNGLSWQYIVNGIDEVVAYKVNFHPTDPSRVYLPMADHGGAVVLDGGESGSVTRYISTPKGYPDDLALCHAILASGDRLLAFGGDEREQFGENEAYRPRVFRSMDNGETWNILSSAGLPSEPMRCIISAVAAPDNGDDILIAIAGTDTGVNGGVYRSTDGANTFARVSGLPVGSDYGDQWSPNADLEVDASDADIRYLFLKNRGLYKSTNRGASWSPVNTGLSNYGVVAADRTIGGHVWAGTCCDRPVALGRSIDAGGSWSPVSGFRSVIDVDAAGDRVAVLGQRDGDTFNKVYYSGDAGVTWNEITRAGYRFGNAQAVAVDPWRSGTVWISTNGRSVARYTPGDENMPTPELAIGEAGVSGENYQLTFEARAGRSYRVEASEDLVAWTSVQSYSNVIGPVTFTENAFRDVPKRFYRVVETAP